MRGLVVAAVLLAPVLAARTQYLLDYGWRFELQQPGPPPQCPPSTQWPFDLTNVQCMGLTQLQGATDEQSCLNACCANGQCETYQWCGSGPCSPANSCWIGSMSQCHSGAGWEGRGRNASTPPGPGPCADPGCSPSTDDSSWRYLNLPHDFVVEGNFSPAADSSHGFLPYGKAWYRKHFTLPPSAQGSTLWLELEAVQTMSSVYLNGHLLGTYGYGYTPQRYFLTSEQVLWGQDNLLAVLADATQPDSWWYDGGGIYRHVWLTSVSAGPYIAPWGVYLPTNVTGAVTWTNGAPFANVLLTPFVEVWNNGSAAATVSVEVAVYNAAGTLVGSTTLTGSVPAGGSGVFSPSAPVSMPDAALWHTAVPPATAALYTAVTTLSWQGSVVDTLTETFGARRLRFDAATGFYLNDAATKILGAANHQDVAAFGVAVPDRMQSWRVNKLQEMGVNGWRTAHNAPTPALLSACDEAGMLVWDETHRNGQLDQLELLIRRDRNHPSIVIWSLCNEVLCNTNTDWVVNALAAKALIKELDPFGGRVVSANQNGWIGPNTPLDMQGFDYNTGSYDTWHAQAPNIPSMSSETSSAVSDRGEYANNATTGHVSGYDVNYPGWGQSAQQAWGGVGESAGQGILTRPYLCGGWTWTGHDYRGEPTPYAWPDVNSHFGIVDAAGFPKDRFYWYSAWFKPQTPLLYLFPHWNWASGDSVLLWAFSNAAAVELWVNGHSAGLRNMTQYGHVEWDGVPFEPGTLHAIAYSASGAVAAEQWVNTTGPPAALRLSVKDGFGQAPVAGCADAALLQVEVVDAAGAVVPVGASAVTFTVTGAGVLQGTANGDPACHTNNLSPTRVSFHGLVLGVVRLGDAAGLVKVSVTSPGLTPDAITLQVLPQPTGFQASWCSTGPRL